MAKDVSTDGLVERLLEIARTTGMSVCTKAAEQLTALQRSNAELQTIIDSCALCHAAQRADVEVIDCDECGFTHLEGPCPGSEIEDKDDD